MKKTYTKPEVEYISFDTKDIITDEDVMDGEQGNTVMSGWEDF